jgi:hypothetical protein
MWSNSHETLGKPTQIFPKSWGRYPQLYPYSKHVPINRPSSYWESLMTYDLWNLDKPGRPLLEWKCLGPAMSSRIKLIMIGVWSGYISNIRVFLDVTENRGMTPQNRLEFNCTNVNKDATAMISHGIWGIAYFQTNLTITTCLNDFKCGLYVKRPHKNSSLLAIVGQTRSPIICPHYIH